MLLICIASVLVCSAAGNIFMCSLYMTLLHYMLSDRETLLCRSFWRAFTEQFSFHHVFHSEFSLVVPKASVSAQLGSSVVLPCSLSPPLDANDFTVKWSKNEDSEKMVLFYKDLKVQETEGDARYKDRVSLIGELRKGDTSLELKNLMMADEGEYVCFVHSFIWYEKGSVNLIVKVLGSPVLITSVDAGELPSQILMVNATCTSDGWYPKPTVTWRDSAGQELLNGSTHYTTDSEGLVSVSSWLLVSPSQSEWISCAVGLNHQEIRESRFVPLRTPNFTSQDSEGVWKEVLISTLVLSLIVLITVAVLLILFKKGLIPHGSSHKDAEAAVTSHESVPTETVPLITTENTKQGTSSKCGSPEPTEEPTEEKQTLRDSNEGSCLSYGAPEPTKEKPPMRHSHKVNSHESLLTDTLPHNITENTKQGQSARAPEPPITENTKQDQIARAPEPPKEPTEDKQIGDSHEENTNQGQSTRAPEPTEEQQPWKARYKVSLTLDPSTAPEGLKVSDDGKSVYCEKRNSKSECKFPYILSKEELGSGQHYWEVMLWDKTTGERKWSWCVGVTQKPHTDNVLRALCYERGTGFYTNPYNFRKIPTDYNMTKLGLHLNCERNSLNFYDADKTSNNKLYTFYDIPQGTYVAFLSPGVKNEVPVRILTEHEISASVKPVH